MAGDSQRFLVAVSGGVDSVLLLDEVLRQHPNERVVVAHVDHGIRAESSEDLQFVRQLAARHDVPFVATELHLGASASEELARAERYRFLRRMSKAHDEATIVTAHHADDVVETIAINLLRGTGWRGLAVFGAQDIYRPMTGWFKDEIIQEAKRRGLDWHEDATNASDAYLRNRVRRRLEKLSKTQKLELVALWRAQHEVKTQLLDEARRHATFQRHPYIMMDTQSAREVLAETLRIPLTRPQLDRVLVAIKTARGGAVYHLSKEWELYFSKASFELRRRKS